MTRTTLPRLTAAITLGAGLTTLVLLLMQSLIESDQLPWADPASAGTLTFLPAIDEMPAVVERNPPRKPPDPVAPPPPPNVVRDHFTGAGTSGVEITPPRLDDPQGPAAGGLSDGEALPVVKVRPVYPSRAQQQGIEGYVLVEFTIDELGRVVDVHVVEAKPRGSFERAALKAVERFRYKPRVVNGQAMPVSGVRHLVSFELDG